MKVNTGSLVDQLRMLRDVQEIERSAPQPSGAPDSGAPKVSFGDVLMQKYEEANSFGVEAERAIEKTIAGKSENPHEAVIAVQKATVSLSLMMGIKQRLERAYQEIIRTPI